jgi:hypothetical protein
MEVLRPVATVPSHFSEEVPYKPNASNCKYTKYAKAYHRRPSAKKMAILEKEAELVMSMVR